MQQQEDDYQLFQDTPSDILYNIYKDTSTTSGMLWYFQDDIQVIEKWFCEHIISQNIIYDFLLLILDIFNQDLGQFSYQEEDDGTDTQLLGT